MATELNIPRQKIPLVVPILNPLIRRLLGLGVPMGPNVLLTVRGRRSGLPRTFPVALMELGGRMFVFGTFGETDWVRNLRAAREAILRRGRRDLRVRATELDETEAPSVLRAALGPLVASPMSAGLIGRWYGVNRSSGQADYQHAARQHPVFELIPAAEVE